MKNFIAAVFFISLLSVVCACKKTSCPEGMHQEKLDNGKTICVPDNIKVEPRG